MRELWAMVAAGVVGVGVHLADGAPDRTDKLVAQLNARAADTSKPRADRCGAVFELFDAKVKPGDGAAAVAAVLTDRSWLAGSVDDRVEILGGLIPVDLNDHDSTFVVRCLATPRADLQGEKWSDWVIYGRISGRTTRTLGPFLAATAAKAPTLVEYSLDYPDGRIEIYGPSGRKSIHM